MRVLFLNLKRASHLINQHPTHTLPPLDIGYCASVLDKNGYETDFIDNQLLQADIIKLIGEIRKKNPDYVVIKPVINTENFVIELSKKLRKISSVKKIVLIGPMATLKYKRFLYRNSPVDACILEEPEFPLLNLLNSYNKRQDIKKIKGMAFFKGFVKINAPEKITNLDALPFPKHDFFLNKGYFFYYPVNINSRIKIGYMLSSRGCPYSCSFCSIVERASYGKKYITRSPRNIADEMLYLKQRGVNTIYFIDDLFTFDKKRVASICEEIRRRKINIKWVVQSRVNTIDEEIAEKMKQVGCSTICLGVESGDDMILKAINKNISRTEIENKVRMLNKKGLLIVGYFIIGNPGETREDILKTINMALSLPFDMIQVHYFTPYPGTSYYKERKKANAFYYKFNQDYNFSKLKGPELVGLYFLFYKSFYFRPGYIASFIIKRAVFLFFNFSLYLGLLAKTLVYLSRKES